MFGFVFWWSFVGCGLDADAGGLVLGADDLPEGELHFEGVAPIVGADAGVVFPFHAD